MKNRSAVRYCIVLVLLSLSAAVSFAQFSGSVQGAIQDPSGAAVAGAKVVLVNVANRVTAVATSDAAGNFQFLSLAPGKYELSAEATAFSKTVISITLDTGQTLNVPISLTLKTAEATVEVTGEPPVLNTAETRNQMTLETQAVSTLPLAGRSMIGLVTLAPGVSGLGTMGGGVPGGPGTPGSGVDNYSTETAVDVSANGQGTMSNMYIVDGLDVTSGIRQGVLNLTPNPDAVQETTIQVNTFSSEYGRSSSLQMTMTTKSGSDQFHGLASDYFNYQNMFARTERMGNATYAPFHSNNFSAAVGGPIIPHHQLFFFFSVEPLRSSTSTGNTTINFVDPQFTSWAQTNYPSTLGTKILTTYVPSHLAGVTVAKTANDIFPGTCGTATTNNLPCSTQMVDAGIFNSTNFRNGTQWNVRVDKYFTNDRIYGSFFRTTLNYGGAAVIPQFGTTNNTWQRAFQVNWTHTFSSTTLNEVIVAGNRVEGKNNETGDFSVPPINVTGLGGGNNYGIGFAQGDFIQHNYHWRDVLTHIRGAHTLKFGYEGWFGDDVEPFQGPYSQPNFAFDNLLALAQDAPRQETNVMFNPLTGKPILWEWNAASKTWGLFGEDVWKIRHNLTLTLGLRWDDSGNPYSRSATTVFGNFYFGPGQTAAEQIANGFAKQTHNALNHSVNNLLSPRLGFAWDPTGHGDWSIRGGAGIFNNWLTQANVQEEFRGNPPGPIQPTFFAAGTGVHPIFTLGDGSKTPPYGFTYPTLAAGLDAHGGIPGAAFNIGGINPNLKSPQTYTVALTVERRIGSRYVASVGYSGSHSTDLVGNGNQAGIVSYGVDINAFAGDLIQNYTPFAKLPNPPQRLNQSFGQITYSANDRESNYNGVFFNLRGRFSRGFFDASYTRSSSKDDAGKYPTALNPHQYYGPSPWDVPNRFSLTLNYQLPGLNHGQGAVGHLTGGWGISGTSIYQTGYPFTVYTNAPFTAILSPTTGLPIGYAPGSGDYNADGDNFDFPDTSSYTQGTSRSSYLTGVFGSPKTQTQFTAPATFGSEGNEKAQRFREPNFAETDAAFYKDTHITERLNLQLRFEFFNIFNRANLGNLDPNMANGTFGQALTQQLPRYWQLGAKFTF